LSPLLPNGQENLAFLLSGLFTTISLSLLSISSSIIIGLALLLLRQSSLKIIKTISISLIEILRAIPILVMLLWVYYGLPITFGIQLSPFAAAVLALALSDSAFETEIFRSGIQSVPIGQKLAAQSLGLKPLHTFRFIILPQALRIILPALGNQYIYVLKMSSLASIIGVLDITRRANELVTITYRPLEIYSFLVLEYLALVLVVSFAVRKIEKYFKKQD
jgi:polar amino acid transport system permease protein